MFSKGLTRAMCTSITDATLKLDKEHGADWARYDAIEAIVNAAPSEQDSGDIFWRLDLITALIESRGL